MTLDISVVIPTFRRDHQLLEALHSVLSQQGIDLEVIVVDDCPDGTACEAVATLADPRVICIKSSDPSGGYPSKVRNMAWPMARGRFIHFLDDDDIVPDGYYARAIKEFELRPSVGLIFGQVRPFGDAPESQLQREREFFAHAAKAARACQWLDRKLLFCGRMLFDMPLFVCSAGIVRRECLLKVDGFDPDMRVMEDAEFYARVMRECGCHFIDGVSIHFRIGYPSLMHSPSPGLDQLRRVRESRRQAQRKYARRHGWGEFLFVALMTRTLVRLVARFY